MRVSITIICYDCQHKNHTELGMPGFEFQQYEFLSFGEAHRHMIEHPDHEMDFRTEVVE